MSRVQLLWIITLCATHAICVNGQSTTGYVPYAVRTCLASEVETELALDDSRNPFYLRGDFNGAGTVDVAVVVSVAGDSVDRLLICEGEGDATLLGGGGFSNHRDDDFVAPVWEALTAEEADRLTNDFSAYVPLPLPSGQNGDVIAFWREDGVAFVYWSDGMYRWAPTRVDR